MLVATIRYVAIGDSFTEGVGDDLPGGNVRGWADLVAQGLADATGETVEYANLAIRGRLLDAIIAEQLEPAIALGPTVISFNGGGNDMLRPGTDLEHIIEKMGSATRRILEAGVEPLLLAGANPTRGLPSGQKVYAKGTELTAAATRLAADLGCRLSDNWNDAELAQGQYWSHDRLHLAPIGHHRVASNVLRTLGYEAPSDWVISAPPIPAPTPRENLIYARQHVLPWIGRRLTGRSSGDGRTAKFATFTEVRPRQLG